MSGDSVSQWSQACIDADAVIGTPPGPHGGVTPPNLGTDIASEALREAYAGFCRQSGLRALNAIGFGKACTEMFGPRIRLQANQSGAGSGNPRPYGYPVPSGTNWEVKLNERLGIK